MFSKGKSSNINIEYITKIVSEAEILGYYLNINKVPCVINSPLRTDRNPSFGLFTTDGIKVYYKDFATGDWGGTFQLLGKLWNLGHNEVLTKIYDELIVGDRTVKKVNILEEEYKGKVNFSPEVNLKVKVREWKQHDIDFWEEYGISLEWLKFSRTYPISHVFIHNKKGKFRINADKYAYVYVEFKDGIPTLKIYQPFSEKFKWTSKHDGSVWDLWEQLPEEGEHLIITSSRKDALCIWENANIPSCSLQAESYLPKEHVVNQLKDRFKKVYVLYDNDFDSEKNPGDAHASNLAKHFNLIKLKIPNKLKVKDTSDLCKKYGRKAVYTTINKLIFNNNN